MTVGPAPWSRALRSTVSSASSGRAAIDCGTGVSCGAGVATGADAGAAAVVGLTGGRRLGAGGGLCRPENDGTAAGGSTPGAAEAVWPAEDCPEELELAQGTDEISPPLPVWSEVAGAGGGDAEAEGATVDGSGAGAAAGCSSAGPSGAGVPGEGMSSSSYSTFVPSTVARILRCSSTVVVCPKR
jgi:hypothetical protein